MRVQRCGIGHVFSGSQRLLVSHTYGRYESVFSSLFLDIPGSQQLDYPVKNKGEIRSMDYDPVTDVVVWSHLNVSKI